MSKLEKMSGYSGYQASPITQQGVVVVNAGIDRLFANFRKGLTGNFAKCFEASDDYCYRWVFA
jgi:hypothetical protein